MSCANSVASPVARSCARSVLARRGGSTLPAGILRLYNTTSGLRAAKGGITWDGTPSIGADGVEPGHGPEFSDMGLQDRDLAIFARVVADTASADIVGDVQVYGPLYVCSDGVKVKVGESASLYETGWDVGDTLDLAAYFVGGQMRAGLLGEYTDPVVVVPDPPIVLTGRGIKTASLPYAASSIPEPYKTASRVWLAKNFDFMINGGADLSFNPNNYFAFYFKSNYYANELPLIKNWCLEKSIPYEDMFNHISVDYTPQELGWKERDKYRVYVGTTDRSTNAYNSSGTVTINGDTYFGHESPFDVVNVVLSTPGDGVTAVYEYWDGTEWSELTVTDGTEAWTVDGAVSFIPPADWAETTLFSGTMPEWWVRVRFTAATTAPVALRMYGDDWYTGSLCRGWDATSETIVNTGALAYNPTPPAGATAKFRHQGRVTGYWTSGNLHLLNFDFEYGGDFPAKRFVADQLLAHVVARPNANALMWDTAFSYGITTFISAPSNAADYCESTFDKTVQMERFQYVRDIVKAVNPDILFGGNNAGAPAEAFEISEWGLLEYYEYYMRFPGRTNNISIVSEETRFTKADGYLPENNPAGIKGFFMYCDGVDRDATYTGFWDRSNRGPIVALAKHYIVWNENIYFSYYSQGGYRYDFSDELLYYKAGTTLSAPITADTSSAVKTITGVDFSGLDRTALGLGTNSVISTAYSNVGLRVRIGDDIFSVTKVDGTTVTTTSPIYQNHAEGAAVRFIGAKHLGTDPAIPPLEDVYRWNWWFPAMDVNIGMPDVSGHNGGARDLAWKTAAEIGGADGTEIWRRDYTGAIVLLRSGKNISSNKPYYTTPCEPVELNGTYYPLYADGTCGDGIASIQLRAGEGAILLKERL